MITKTLAHDGIMFLAREGTSDEKTFDEVIVRKTYQRGYFKIEKGEKWIDLGGNVGAFALFALQKGAIVDVYEPDPFNCKQIEKNLALNGFNANIYQEAVVANNQDFMTMYVGNNNQVWRNSLYRDWGNQKFKVPCTHFSEVFKNENDNCKMDIEGAEMEIVEAMNVFPKKMVVEWSLDIDPKLERYRKAVDRLKRHYTNVKHSKQFYNLPDYVLPKHIFPACDNFYCYE